LAIRAPLAGELGLPGEEETLRCFGRLSSIERCSWPERGEEAEEEEREDCEMLEMVRLGVRRERGESSVSEARRTGGGPAGPPVCTPASCRRPPGSSCRTRSSSCCSTPQFSLNSPIMSVIFSISSCGSARYIHTRLNDSVSSTPIFSTMII
jgi:hypothetical protein